MLREKDRMIFLFHRNYSYHTDENAKFGIKRDTVTQMPRLILEILAVSILIFIVYVLTYQGKTLAEVLVLLGVFFLQHNKIASIYFKNRQSNSKSQI